MRCFLVKLSRRPDQFQAGFWRLIDLWISSTRRSDWIPPSLPHNRLQLQFGRCTNCGRCHWCPSLLSCENTCTEHILTLSQAKLIQVCGHIFSRKRWDTKVLTIHNFLFAYVLYIKNTPTLKIYILVPLQNIYNGYICLSASVLLPISTVDPSLGATGSMSHFWESGQNVLVITITYADTRRLQRHLV